MNSVIILFNLWKMHMRAKRTTKTTTLIFENLKNIVFFRISPYIIWELTYRKQFGYSITIMPFRFVLHILKTLTENNEALEVFLDEFRCNMSYVKIACESKCFCLSKFLFWKNSLKNIAFSPYLHISIYGEVE